MNTTTNTTKTAKKSNAQSFLDSFCASTNLEKDVLRASTNRAAANYVKAKVNQYNGLSEEEFNNQFKELMKILGEYSTQGTTQIKFKYVSKTTPATIEDGVEDVVNKTTATDYIISAMASGGAFDKITVSSPKNFRKMLSASLTYSTLRELGYKVNKSVWQSNRRGRRLFDILDVNWTSGK